MTINISLTSIMGRNRHMSRAQTPPFFGMALPAFWRSTGILRLGKNGELVPGFICCFTLLPQCGNILPVNKELQTRKRKLVVINSLRKIQKESGRTGTARAAQPNLSDDYRLSSARCSHYS